MSLTICHPALPGDSQVEALAPIDSPLELMQPSLGLHPFTSSLWDFQLPSQGYRVLAQAAGGRGRLVSRSGIDLVRWFPEFEETFVAWVGPHLVLDGEICMLDSAGRMDSARLHERALRPQPALREQEAFLCVQDVLVHAGRDVRSLPWSRRRSLLQDTGLDDLPHVAVQRTLHGEGVWLHRQARALGLRAIHARHVDARYCAGRSDHWLEIPCAEPPPDGAS